MVSAGQIESVRRFNRFYTKWVGALDEGLLESPYSLVEVRVLYEIAHRSAPGAIGPRSTSTAIGPRSTTAAELAAELGLDRGYLSRILRGFERDGLLRRRRSPSDGRESLLALTSRGRAVFAPLDARSSAVVGSALAGLPIAERRRLVRAMGSIEGLLAAPDSRDSSPVTLRDPRPGDLGWVVHRHGVLYAEEYGWDGRFEALVAEIVSQFVLRFDAGKERCWIAEARGEVVGSVFLVKKSETVAKLRLLYVEPDVRGLGIGARLVAECVAFAESRGYERIVLWTQSVLEAARHIYRKAGFRVVAEEANESFGKSLVSETWERSLRA